MSEYDDGPEWGYCKSPGCNEPAEPLWFAGSFPDDPDLLCCYKHTGLFIGALRTERNLLAIERGLLEKELAAAVAHHERVMDIIEKALGEDRRTHEGVWLAESIALDIKALRGAAALGEAMEGDSSPTAISLLRWVVNCWPKRDEDYCRADMEDCVDAIRSFLAQAEREAMGR